jgi:WD40 repeat protein
LHTLTGHQQPVSAIAFSPDGQQLVSSSFDKTIKLWNVNSGKCLKTFTGHQGPIINAKFSIDRRSIVSVGVDRTLKVWDIQTEKCLHTLNGHGGLIYTLDLGNVQLLPMASPKLFAFTGSLDETIKVWDLAAGKCVTTWKSRRPYEGMQIDKIHGLTTAQQASLQALGAIRNGGNI